MPVRLFVGNLPYDTTEVELREHFAAVGPLSHVFIPVDRETGRPRGFAFVEFAEREHAESAISRLNNQGFKGRPLSVSEARARDDRPSGLPRTGGPGPGGPGGPPRPFGGPPRTDWTPRPAPGGPPGPGGPPSGERPRRNFGPDAPRKGFGKPKGPRRDEKVGGPIPIRSGGRIYDVDDFGEEVTGEEPEASFDDIASSEVKNEDDES